MINAVEALPIIAHVSLPLKLFFLWFILFLLSVVTRFSSKFGGFGPNWANVCADCIMYFTNAFVP